MPGQEVSTTIPPHVLKRVELVRYARDSLPLSDEKSRVVRLRLRTYRHDNGHVEEHEKCNHRDRAEDKP